MRLPEVACGARLPELVPEELTGDARAFPGGFARAPHAHGYSTRGICEETLRSISMLMRRST
jgi:hypothetical protein